MANPYFTCELEAWRSGTTLYGRMHYYRTGSHFYKDPSFPNPVMDLAGTTVADTVLGDKVREGVYVGDIYGGTYSRTVAGTGSRTVTYTAGSGTRSDFAGEWSETVGGFPGVYTAPNTPTVTAAIKSPTSLEITYGTTSFGTPSTGTVKLYGGTSTSPTTLLETKSTTGNSTFSYTGLTQNTAYYFKAVANNGQLSSNSKEFKITIPVVSTLYGSVNDETKRITKLYGSVAVPILYYRVASIANNPHLSVNIFNSVFSSSFPKLRVKQPTVFNVSGTTTNGSMYLRFSDNSYQTLASWTSFAQYQSACNYWGFGLYQPQNGNVSAVSYIGAIEHVAKRITKLYGSVNGEAKRIF